MRVVENRSARGLSGARNTGAFAASGEIVAFLDDDALADTGWMKRLTAGYDADDVVAYGGIVLPMIAGRRPDWWPIEFDWVIGCSYTGLPSGPSHIRNLIGANMSVRRQALLDLNGFRSDVGRIGSDRFGCEETEFFIRLTQDRPDARIVYDPTVVVRHEVPAKRLSWRYFSSRCYAEGRSKAAVSRSVGSKSALASERSYLLKVLPRAMASGLLRAARRERGAAQRTLAIAAGALITAAGYVRGRVAMARWQAST